MLFTSACEVFCVLALLTITTTGAAIAAPVMSADKIKLTVNHATGTNSVNEDDIRKVLHQEVFWSIPHDLEVSACLQRGMPVVIDKPSSRVSQSIVDLAAQLAGMEAVPVEGNGRAYSNYGNDASASILRKLLRR